MSREIFVKIKKISGDNAKRSILISSDENSAMEWRADQKREKNSKNEISHKEKDSFQKLNNDLFDLFISYYDFVPLIVSVARMYPSLIIDNEIYPILKNDGKLISSDEEYELFSLGEEHYADITKRMRKIDSISSLSPSFPNIFIMGLISHYDVFVNRLARIVIGYKPHIVFNKESTVSYADLSKFDSVADLKNVILDRELEKLMRMSHHEQFKWFSEALNIKMEPERELYSRFIELCERRNLFAHTGGVVNQYYLEKGKIHGYNVEGIKLGEKIHANSRYFKDAVDSVIEISFQLVSTVWSKSDLSSSEDISKSLINITYSLISEEKYAIAIKLIEYVMNNRNFNMDNSTRMTHIINCANAKKLSGDNSFKDMLESEDWSGVSLKYYICKESVLENVENVCAVLESAVASGDVGKNEIREWPVFRSLLKNDDFSKKFIGIFNEPILLKQEEEIDPSEEKEPTSLH